MVVLEGHDDDNRHRRHHLQDRRQTRDDQVPKRSGNSSSNDNDVNKPYDVLTIPFFTLAEERATTRWGLLVNLPRRNWSTRFYNHF